MFKHLKDLDIKQKTMIHVFYELEGEPEMECLPATEANAPYFNAVLKEQGKTLRRMRAGKLSGAMLKENREVDRKLYPLHVVQGWPKPPLGENGQPVNMDREATAEFFQCLPDWILDRARNEIGTPSNFVDDDDIDQADAEEEGNA